MVKKHHQMPWDQENLLTLHQIEAGQDSDLQAQAMRILAQRKVESEVLHGRPHSAWPYFDPLESGTQCGLLLADSMESKKKERVINDFDSMVGPMMLGSFYPQTKWYTHLMMLSKVRLVLLPSL